MGTAMNKRNQPVQTRTITNASVAGTYVPVWRPTRPGAEDHEKVPSLQGVQRVFRDGRVEEVTQ
jgi:hypothetical protein